MKKYSGPILFVLVTVVFFSAGCTNQPAPEVSGLATTPMTPVPTTVSPPVTVTSIILTPLPTVATITSAVVPVKTPLPEADPTDMAAITFEFYYDNDFSVEYPSTWTIDTPLNIPYPVGPFYVDYDPHFNPQYRIVTFTSPDHTKKFVVLTQDFVQAGTFTLNPTIDWARQMFQRDYPDLSAANYLQNYKYFAIGTGMASSYDVTLPEGTHYYPSAYTIETIVSPLHAHNFGFFTDTANFNKYSNLKEIMIGSVKTPDTEIHSVSTVGNSSTVI
jgi:hypothetical protein